MLFRSDTFNPEKPLEGLKKDKKIKKQTNSVPVQKSSNSGISISRDISSIADFM